MADTFDLLSYWVPDGEVRQGWRSFRRWRLSVALGGILVGVMLFAAELFAGGIPVDVGSDDVAASSRSRWRRKLGRERGHLQAKLAVSHLKGWVSERQLDLRASAASRIRGGAATAHGDLYVQTDELIWLPTRLWRSYGARDLLIRWDAVRSCQVVPLRRHEGGLTLLLADESECWLLVKDVRALARALAGTQAPRHSGSR